MTNWYEVRYHGEVPHLYARVEINLAVHSARTWTPEELAPALRRWADSDAGQPGLTSQEIVFFAPRTPPDPDQPEHVAVVDIDALLAT
jgi:hypothetical protein